MNCKSKITKKCLSTTYAPCVRYEKDRPEISLIPKEDCASIEDTTDDLYKITQSISDNIDLSELGTKCLTYIKDVEGKNTVKNVLLKYEEEICRLTEEVNNIKTEGICNTDITSCVDTTTIQDPCGENITTLGQLLQFLTNKHK